MLLYHTHVQPLTSSYRRQITDFISQCYADTDINTTKISENETVVLMQRNSKILGLCLLRYEAPESDDFDWEAPYWVITVLCVHPSERRKGRASEILEYVVNEICTHNTQCRAELRSNGRPDDEEVAFLTNFFSLRKIELVVT